MTTSQTRETSDAIQVDIRDVGGISESTVSPNPGVTVLTGRNATNRTSFLQALMAGLGSDSVSLKVDSDAGRVDLSLNNETYTRTLERVGTGVRTDGDPYLSDPELADLFAFLVESNETRLAVARGDDFHELIMRSVDTADIIASPALRSDCTGWDLEESSGPVCGSGDGDVDVSILIPSDSVGTETLRGESVTSDGRF